MTAADVTAVDPGDLRVLLRLHGLTLPPDMEAPCLAAMAEVRRQAAVVAALTDVLEEPVHVYDVRRTVQAAADA